MWHVLEEEAEQANNDCEKGYTLNESGNHNHVCTNCVCSLGLTGNGFHSRTADAADTEGGTNSGQAGADAET